MTDGLEITCRELVELVTDYLEGAMSAEDRARVDAHLSTCDGCQNYLEQMRETIRLTGRLTEAEIPEAQRRRLIDAFRDWQRTG